MHKDRKHSKYRKFIGICSIRILFFLTVMMIVICLGESKLDIPRRVRYVTYDDSILNYADQQNSSRYSSKNYNKNELHKQQDDGMTKNKSKNKQQSKVELKPIQYSFTGDNMVDTTWDKDVLGTVIHPQEDLKNQLQNAESIVDFESFVEEQMMFAKEKTNPKREQIDKYYLIDEKKYYKIYGKGDLHHLIFSVQDEDYLRVKIPYTSVYGEKPYFAAYDYDMDGLVELLMILSFKKGDTTHIDRLFILDQDRTGLWRLYQMTESIYMKPYAEHVAYNNENGLQLYLNEKPVGRKLTGLTSSDAVGLGNQIKMNERYMALSIDMTLIGYKDGEVTKEEIPYHILANVSYVGDGRWRFEQFSFYDYEISNKMYDLTYAYYLNDSIAKMSKLWNIENYGTENSLLRKPKETYNYDQIKPCSISYNASDMNQDILKVTITVQLEQEKEYRYLFVRLKYIEEKKQGKWIVNWVSEHGDTSINGDYFIEGTNFTCNGYIFNIWQREPSLKKLTNAYTVGSYICIEGETNKGDMYLGVFSYHDFGFVGDDVVDCYMWTDDKISTLIYCYKGDFYDINQRLIARCKLLEEEKIQHITYCKNGKDLEVEIWKNGSIIRVEKILMPKNSVSGNNIKSMS